MQFFDPPPSMPPLLSEPAARPAKKLVGTWVAGGVAVASLGAGIGLGFGAQSNATALRGEMVRSQTQNQALHDDARNLSIAANAAYGVAAVAAVTAVILFLVER